MNSTGDDLANGALVLLGGAIDLKPLHGITSFPYSPNPLSFEGSVRLMQRIYAKMKYRYKRKILFNQSTEEEVAGYKKFLALRTPEAKMDEKHPSGPRASIEALRDQRAPAAVLDADHSATPGSGTPGPGAYSTVHSSIGSGPRFSIGTSVRWGYSDLILRNGLWLCCVFYSNFSHNIANFEGLILGCIEAKICT